MELIIYTDGASRISTGEAGIGIIIKRDNEQTYISRYIGIATNNIAEYTAAIAGLEYAIQMGASVARLFSDSELLVRQINGKYKVKNNDLKPLHSKIMGLIEKIGRVKIQYIPREQNKEADALAKKAIVGERNGK